MRWALLGILVACNFEHGRLGTGDRDARPGDAADDDATGSADDGGSDGSGGGIAFVGYTTSASSNSATVMVPATATSGATYVLGVATKPYTATTVVVGLGATWTPIGDQCGARSQTGTAVYIGRGATLSGMVAVTLASPPMNAVATLGVYTGSTSHGAVAVYNALDATTCSETDTGVDIATYAFSINSTGGHVVASVATRQQTHTPGATLVQRAQHFQGSSGNTAGVALVDGMVTQVTGMLATNVDVAAVAVELR